MDEKLRQRGMDKLRPEQADTEHAFDQIALTIARADVPLSKDPASKLTPEERAATPADWINNYAEGFTRSGKCSHEEAVTGIRSAFEERYGMSPEAYADQYTPQQAAKDKAVESAIEKVRHKEQDEIRHRDSRDQGRERGEH